MGCPKPQSLCAAVAGHHSALEADLARFYSADLLDLWRGTLSWRKLAQYVTWLPPDAALFQSMRLARPAKPTTGELAKLKLDDPVEAARNGTSAHLAELLLLVLNRIEVDQYARSDPAKRGEFKPTLPPGYAPAAGAADDPGLYAAYLAAMQPPPD